MPNESTEPMELTRSWLCINCERIFTRPARVMGATCTCPACASAVIVPTGSFMLSEAERARLQPWRCER